MGLAKLIRAKACERQSVIKLKCWRRWLIFVFTVCAPAHAEVSSEVEIKSDDRFRGRSLSAGQPTIDADISLDDASGIYVGGSASVIMTKRDRAGFQSADVYAGFTSTIAEKVTIDLGITNYVFSKRYSGNAKATYTELYAGLVTGNFATYVHYSADYVDKSVPVIYTDVSFSRTIGSAISVKAHAGLLMQTGGTARLGGRSTRYDTRLAVSRPILGLNAELAWTYAGPDDRYFDGPWNGNSALVFSVAKNF